MGRLWKKSSGWQRNERSTTSVTVHATLYMTSFASQRGLDSVTQTALDTVTVQTITNLTVPMLLLKNSTSS